MDTGIDYDHPDLGGCFGPRAGSVTGWDFVGDAFNADDTAGLQSDPDSRSDPDDCNGHGTHVSGIVGANGAVKGVAPASRSAPIGSSAVQGSTTADIMLAAMERRSRTTCDVLNMSIGSAFQWPQYPTRSRADRLVRSTGIVVVASIGNSGANGLYAAGAPGVGEKVIGVASFDNTHLTLNTSLSRPTAGSSDTTGPSASPTAADIGHVPAGAYGYHHLCRGRVHGAAPAGSLTGKVALIRRGTCTFT